MRSLKEIFDEVIGPIFEEEKNVKRLVGELYGFKINFINKKSDHLHFFGSNLLGNYVVRFTTKELDIFFNELLSVSKETLDFYIRQDSSINKDFKISSDSFNITCTYLIYRFLTTKVVDEKLKNLGAFYVASIFVIRHFTSIMTNFFKYPCSDEMAEAVYNQLSMKYLIKKLGTWGAVMDYRANELISKENPNYKALQDFNDDSVVRYINDSQGRVKDLIKNIAAVFFEIKDIDNIKASTIKAIGKNLEGENEFNLEITGGAEGYINYLISVIGDQNSFIKKELVEVMAEIVKTTQKKYIEKTLAYMSASMTDTEMSKEVTEFVRLVLTHSYQYLKDNKYLSKNSKNIISILGKLKGVYMASRNNEDTMLEIRDKGDAIVKKAIGKINVQAQAATRSACVLYICLRCYSRHYFTE